jgi:hypothetical protein
MDALFHPWHASHRMASAPPLGIVAGCAAPANKLSISRQFSISNLILNLLDLDLSAAVMSNP